jgi:hypothetical protein
VEEATDSWFRGKIVKFVDGTHGQPVRPRDVLNATAAEKSTSIQCGFLFIAMQKPAREDVPTG